MFDVGMLCGTNDHILGYKIVEKKYVKNIVKDGQIYFGLLQDYRKMEQQDRCSIGDSKEASLSMNVQQFIEIDNKYVEIHGFNAGNNARFNAKQCAFCFFMEGLKSFTKCSDGKYRYHILNSDLQRICKDKGGISQCSLIIFDIDLVFKICDELISRKLPYMSGKIIYDDFYYIPKSDDIKSRQYALECCFHKEKRFSYQHEFRIATLNTENKPINDLFVDVEDDYFQVMDLKDGYDFCCCADILAEKKDFGKVDVCFNFTHDLIKSKTEIQSN